MDDTSQASFDTVMAFMGAMGGGDMDAMSALMADDMVWQRRVARIRFVTLTRQRK